MTDRAWLAALLLAGDFREFRFRCGRLGYFDSEIVRYSWPARTSP